LKHLMTQSGTENHFGRHSPSQVIDDLHPLVHVASRSYPTNPSPLTQASTRVTFDQAVKPGHFSDQEGQAIGYRSVRGLLRFGTSPNGLTGKPYAFGPFVVKLFAAPGFSRGPRARSSALTPPLTRFGSSLRQPG